MAQNITTTSDTRLCKRVIYEHTRKVWSVFLVPKDALKEHLVFDFNDGDTELRYYGDTETSIVMPRVELEPLDDNNFFEEEVDQYTAFEDEVDQYTAKLDDETFKKAVNQDDLAKLEQEGIDASYEKAKRDRAAYEAD